MYSNLKRDLLLASLAKDSLLNFMLFLHPSYIVGRHTRAITERLTTAIQDLKKGKSTYLILTVPFRHGKSDIVSRHFPPWCFGHDPDLEILLATYGQDLSSAMSRDARGIIRHPDYAKIFPSVRISAESSSTAVWGIAGHKGKFQAVGIGGGSTGKGADILIIDDYLKGRSEAESETVRKTQWDDFTGNLMTRLAPAHIVVILATPWHVDDLIGRIKDRMNPLSSYHDPDFPAFEILSFPAKAEDGSFLFPERFSPQWYRTQFATLGTYQASALLQCDPSPRGGPLFRSENIRIVDSVPDNIRYCRFWDLASTEKERTKDDPDYTAGALVGACQINKEWHIYIKDVKYIRAEAPARNKLIEQTAAADGMSVRIGVESVAGYKDTYTILRSIIKNRVINKIAATKDKVIRCSELEAPVEAGHLYFLRGEWNNHVLAEFASFPAGKHDDCVDAIAGGFAMARKINGPSRIL